ncbi:MAG TPA: hypothetical protein VFK54_05420 [Candidatus Limnocylindrales bacterium]|nr:hypothetical protein [Candidatus Limnocylindrales bacterium]
MADAPKSFLALRRSRSTLADAQAAAGGIAAGVRGAFRAVRPDDLVQAVREGPVKAVREMEPRDLGKGALQTRDAVLEAVAAIAAEIARDPGSVPAALAKLPRAVTDRLPDDVLDRLPSPIAERVPVVRRRRRRRLAIRLAIVGGLVAIGASIVAVVLRRRAEERRQVAMGAAADPAHPDGLDPVPDPAPETMSPVEATDAPDAELAGGLPGMAPVDETRSVE